MFLMVRIKGLIRISSFSFLMLIRIRCSSRIVICKEFTSRISMGSR